MILINGSSKETARFLKMVQELPHDTHDNIMWYMKDWSRLEEDSERGLFPEKEISAEKLEVIYEYLKGIHRTEYIKDFLEVLVENGFSISPESKITYKKVFLRSENVW